MARTDNYLIQAQQAKACFLTYDAEALAKKLNAKLDADFLYTTFFGQSYRVSRKTGDIQRLEDGAWQDGNSYGSARMIKSVPLAVSSTCLWPFWRITR